MKTENYFLNNSDVIFTSPASSPPIKTPTMTERTMTTAVSLIVSALVGQVTFFSSAATSFINRTGDAIFGTAGLAISIH